MSYPNVLLLIDNVWREGRRNATRAVHNPANEEVIGTVALATTTDLDDAVACAASGFEVWRRTPAVERTRVMLGAAELLTQRAESIANLLTLEQGKPLAESRAEIAMSADIIRWAANEAPRIYGRIVPPRAAGVQQMVQKEPVGPVAAFTPWNFPIAQVARKVAPALASGCSLVLKAAEETPASAAELVRAFVDAGLPAGVLALVFGEPAEISEHLITHRAIRKITFTGSTPVGKQLAALAGMHMKRVTMELGGHAPVIVAADADVARAARTLADAKFRNAGQICLSPTRMMVAQTAFDEFMETFLARIREIRVGDGMLEGSTMGPLANKRRLDAMERLTHDALSRGASLATGGVRLGDSGNFFAPTVLTEPSKDSLVLNSEPFGPVATVWRFAELGEAIAEANRLDYGLSAYAFTRAIKTVSRLAAEVQAGTLWVNQAAAAWPELPFGGVKDSGYGYEGGPESLDAYLQAKTVAISDV
ncbi:NAD-dependent succinate-semialdehyde dehydrogenase [Paraburkholderia antibiotica]|uniref:NAD-dependent succinate-semialdehyde dehydrogenase n=1 Tax=Paraburkholderia antibiotica TaxID=2728839 RepID=A0A7Y0FFJ0_9BURK|nr:NAD-dependent succinate-semialdehyde dehydrogenase [Paraburkholderia antibiotica]NML34189.1 NAD-dependent succinate-semialdehyde dehydrogenase [Paraburkholderia antibiotica]